MTRCISSIALYPCRTKAIAILGVFWIFVWCMSGCSPGVNGFGFSRTITARDSHYLSTPGHDAVSTITVTDSHYLGVPGDDAISISEAILLATGDLAFSDLSSNEALLVKGTPGFGHIDRIQIKPGLRISIEPREEAVDSILPVLYDEGDILEGNGAILDGSPMNGAFQPAPGEVFYANAEKYGSAIVYAPLILISASHVEVCGLVVEKVPASAVSISGKPDNRYNGISIRDNKIMGLGVRSFSNGIGITAGYNVDNSTLTDITIENNTISDIHDGICVYAAVASGSKQKVRNNRIDGVKIRGNRIERSINGLWIDAAYCVNDGSSEDNKISNLEVVENQIDSNFVCAIIVSTTRTQFAGESARNTIKGITINDNIITNPENFSRSNTGMLLTCGQITFGGSSTDDKFEDIVIEQNVVKNNETGIKIFAGFGKFYGDESKIGRGTMCNVAIRDNQWLNVSNGCVFAGGMSAEMSGQTVHNLLKDILLERETIVSKKVGYVLAGSLAGSFEMGDTGYNRSGLHTANSIRGLEMRDCSIQAPSPVLVFGGSVTAEDDTVEASTVEEIVLSNNTINGPAPGISIFGGMVTDLGTVKESIVQNVQVLGTHDTQGNASQVYYMDETVTNAPAESVSGNHVYGVDIQ